MFSDYYKKELRRLKEVGKEFAAEHPVLASQLASPTGDPDVERLLDGVAFLTANINRKLDDVNASFNVKKADTDASD